MVLSAIDDKPALIIIDLQQGLASVPYAHDYRTIVERAASLASAFRRFDLPVVLVNVAGRAPGRTDEGSGSLQDLPPGWSELEEALDARDTDLRVTKYQRGPFHDTELEELLRARRVTQVFLAGVFTSQGVESAARTAYDSAYHVVLVVDAMTDADAAAHANSVERIFPKLGETSTCDEVVAMLEQVHGAR
jgi:nicotinamidase-related amidase